MANLTRYTENSSFENDFGQEPVALGHVLKNPQWVGTLGAVGGLFVAGMGLPALLVWVAIILNDVMATARADDFKPAGSGAPPAPVPLPPAEGTVLSAVATPAALPPAISAVEVPAQPVPSAPVWQRPKTSLNVPEQLAAFKRSAIILGAPGSGKGYVAASALGLLPSGVTVWLLDPKNDPTEAQYWGRVPMGQRLQFNALKKSERPSADTIISFVEAFFENNARDALLIIDEVPALQSCMSKQQFQELMSFVAIAASSGRSRKLNCWAISQSSNVADLGINGQSKAAFMTYAMAATAGADFPTPESWFSSFRSSMGVVSPTGEVTGPYIVSDCDRWFDSVVPPLKSFTPEPAPAEPIGFNEQPQQVSKVTDPFEVAKQQISDSSAVTKQQFTDVPDAAIFELLGYLGRNKRGQQVTPDQIRNALKGKVPEFNSRPAALSGLRLLEAYQLGAFDEGENSFLVIS